MVPIVLCLPLDLPCHQLQSLFIPDRVTVSINPQHSWKCLKKGTSREDVAPGPIDTWNTAPIIRSIVWCLQCKPVIRAPSQASVLGGTCTSDPTSVWVGVKTHIARMLSAPVFYSSRDSSSLSLSCSLKPILTGDLTSFQIDLKSLYHPNEQ